MKLALFKHYKGEEYDADTERIKAIFASYGILIPYSDIILAWAKYSKTKNSEWEPLPDNDGEIYLAIVDYLDINEW